MVNLYSVDKYYDVEFNKLDYNVLVKSSNWIIDEIEVFKYGERITGSEEAAEMLEYFYDNIEPE